MLYSCTQHGNSGRQSLKGLNDSRVIVRVGRNTVYSARVVIGLLYCLFVNKYIVYCRVRNQL